MIPSNMHIPVLLLILMSVHTWTLVGCFVLGRKAQLIKDKQKP